MNRKLEEMNNEELGRLFPIIISEYKPEWTELFRQEKDLVEQTIGASRIVGIHHFGSTSVPGLCAKPTIDILLEINRDIEPAILIEQLRSIGYNYTPRPESPAPHMMFMKGYTLAGFLGQAYHVHVRYPGDWDELYFRDYLKSHPETAKEYVRLKRQLKLRYEFNRDAYTEGKTEFIKSVTQKARNEI